MGIEHQGKVISGEDGGHGSLVPTPNLHDNQDKTLSPVAQTLSKGMKRAGFPSQFCLSITAVTLLDLATLARLAAPQLLCQQNEAGLLF